MKKIKKNSAVKTAATPAVTPAAAAPIDTRDPTDTREAKLGAFVRYKPCEDGDWGPVLVMAGIHKGKIGYYDDEDERNPKKGIVYFGIFAPDTPHAFIALDKMARLPDDFCSFVTTDSQDAALFPILGVNQKVTPTDDAD